jgi:hypothetical protein
MTKKLAMPGFFFYNDKCVLLFEQVPKREGGEARISQVERLWGGPFLGYVLRT